MAKSNRLLAYLPNKRTCLPFWKHSQAATNTEQSGISQSLMLDWKPTGDMHDVGFGLLHEGSAFL